MVWGVIIQSNEIRLHSIKVKIESGMQLSVVCMIIFHLWLFLKKIQGQCFEFFILCVLVTLMNMADNLVFESLVFNKLDCTLLVTHEAFVKNCLMSFVFHPQPTLKSKSMNYVKG